MNKQKVIGLILGVVLFIALIAGLTYAYVSWNSDNINLKVNSECFNILYDSGTNISGPIMPSLDYTGGRYVTVKMDLSSSCTLVEASGKISLNTLDSTSSNLYKEGVLNYQLLINNEVTDIKGNITESGTIEFDVGQLNKKSVATTTYTIYVWVNAEHVTNEHVSSTYYGNISAEAVQIENVDTE